MSSMPNPYLDQLMQRYRPGYAQPQQPNPIQPLAPEEEDSLLSKIGGKVMGGLGYVGSVLDKSFGGRALRGVLGGKPEELLSVIPGSDTFGLTDETNRVSGTDLLGNAGIIDKNDPGILGHALGMATEIGLDPSTYLTFGAGALGKGGQIARKINPELVSSAAKRVGGTLGGLTTTTDLSKLGEFTQRAKLASDELTKMGVNKFSDVASQALGGHVGLGLPLMAPSATFDLTKPLGAAGKALSYIPGSGAVANAADVAGRNLGALFGYGNKQMIEPETQLMAKGVTSLEDATKANVLKNQIGPLLEYAHGNNMLDPATNKLLPQHAEDLVRAAEVGVNVGANVAPPSGLSFGSAGLPELRKERPDRFTALINQVGDKQVASRLSPEVQGLFDQVKPLLEQNLAEGQAVGRQDAQQLADTIGHFPRENAILEGKGGAFNRQSLAQNPTPGREEIFRGIPTVGPRSLTEMTGPRLMELKGMTDVQRDATIAKDYLGYSQKELSDLKDLRQAEQSYREATTGNGGLWEQTPAAADKQKKAEDLIKSMRPDWKSEELFNRTKEGPTNDLLRIHELEAKQVQAQRLSNWVKTSVPDEAAAAGGFFNRDPLGTLGRKLVKDSVNNLKADAMHNAIGSLAMTADDAARQGIKGVPLGKMLDDAGLTLNIGSSDYTGKWLPEAMSGKIGSNELLAPPLANAKGLAEANPTKGAMTATLDALKRNGLDPGSSLEDLNRLVVPERIANDMLKFNKATSTPAGLAPFLKVYDGATAIFKGMNTVIWPANQVRNEGTALFQNWMRDAFDPRYGANPVGYAKPFLDAKTWKEGGIVSGANQIQGLEHLAEGEASKELGRELTAWQSLRNRRPQTQAIEGSDLTQRAGGLPVPGQPFGKGLVEGLQEAGAAAKTKEGWNPLSVGGVPGVGEGQFAPVKAGRHAQSYLDEINWASAYIAKRRQGFLPEAAKAEADTAHFRFGDLTDVEKSVGVRAVPFYNWMKQAIGSSVGELAERPGGKLAQLARATHDTESDQQGFVPDYLSKGIVAPLGESAPGTQRYLTSFGLPAEDLGGLINPQGPARSVEQLLGNLNPAIKAPLEWATGKQFYSGRDLADLSTQGLTGNSLADQLIMNSPVARGVTTYNTLTDPRKGLGGTLMNLLTGAKVTDVDTEKAKNVAARQYINDTLKGSENVKTFDRLYSPKESIPNLTPEEMLLLRLNLTQQQRAKNAKKAG